MRPEQTDGQTDRQTDRQNDKHQLNLIYPPLPWEIINIMTNADEPNNTSSALEVHAHCTVAELGSK